MKKKAIMFQGVSSSAGKSICAVALCRLLKRQGFSVAPFKAQNMSLNSFVTREGGEMGRAQALQAMACGLEPCADMNPVLLKPMGDSLSQLIVRGKVRGEMTYQEFMKLKARLWDELRESYERLAASADIMVLEGAGSPAEINLQKHDIVNMRMAHEAQAAVLLVADIDRGGAFASLAGTMSLVKASDRKLVKGFVLNRFRGDKGLLAPALEKMEKRYHRPFMGIIPMIEDLRLPEEDSTALEGLGSAYRPSPYGNAEAFLDVVAPLLPALSNFTDLDPLASEKNVRIRLVRNAEEFGEPDLVIIPGSRKSVAALAWLEEKGLAGKIREYAAKARQDRKGHIVGICAGLQLMGQIIEDPCNVEGGGVYKALGLLPLVTKLEEEKILKRCIACALPPICGCEMEVEGYEIHHGRSFPEKEASGLMPVIRDIDGQCLGWGICGGEGISRAWGTYLHGIFDDNDFRHAFLEKLIAEAGVEAVSWNKYDVDKEIDRLADIFSQNMDMTGVFEMLDL